MASVRSHIGNPGETARGIAAATPDGHTMPPTRSQGTDEEETLASIREAIRAPAC
jgi:hypothetical protein